MELELSRTISQENRGVDKEVRKEHQEQLWF